MLGKLLRFPLRFVPGNLVLPILQGRLRGYKWIAGSATHGCWLGDYEFKKQALVVEKISRGQVVFDIGAHVGFYTLLFSALVGPSGVVVAFEPLPRNLRYLHEHIRLNQIKNVQVIEAAVTDRSGNTLFQELSSSFTGRVSERGQLLVPQVSTDNLISDGKVPKPDYLKIDIEGGEYAALRGAQVTLGDYHPGIFLATHGQDVHEQCCTLLAKLGYELRSVTGESIPETSELLAEGRRRQ